MEKPLGSNHTEPIAPMWYLTMENQWGQSDILQVFKNGKPLGSKLYLKRVSIHGEPQGSNKYLNVGL